MSQTQTESPQPAHAPLKSAFVEESLAAEQLLPLSNEPPYERRKTIALGASARIVPLDNGTVFKKYHLFDNAQLYYPKLPEWQLKDLEMDWHLLRTERLAFERLHPHPRTVGSFGNVQRGMILERGQCVRLLIKELHAKHESLDPKRALKWSLQAAEGLAYMHSKNVMHSDVHTHNMLYNDRDDLIICDFGQASIDGGSVHGVYSPQYCRPGYGYEDSSVPNQKDEIFALGTVIYELTTASQPYQGESDKFIENEYKAGRFADTTGLLTGQVIKKCWLSQYDSVAEVVADLERLRTGEELRREEDLHGGESNADHSRVSDDSLILLGAFALAGLVAAVFTWRRRVSTANDGTLHRWPSRQRHT